MTLNQFEQIEYEAMLRSMHRFNKQHGQSFTLPESVSPEILKTPEWLEEIIKAAEERDNDHRANV